MNISRSKGCFCIRCHLFIRIFLRSGIDGRYSVTNGKILLRVFCLFCRADILWLKLTLDRICSKGYLGNPCVKQGRGCESEHTKISYRETKNLTLDELLQSLERIPWDTAFVFKDIDDILNAFESMLNDVLDQHLPWKNRRVKRQNQPPWMNDEIMKLIRQRDNYNLLKTARRTNLSIDWSLYTRAKCKTSNSIKYAKRCFFQETID